MGHPVYIYILNSLSESVALLNTGGCIDFLVCVVWSLIRYNTMKQSDNYINQGTEWKTVMQNWKTYAIRWGTAVTQWLRRCATNQKIAGSTADGVIGIFHWHNPSDRTMALGVDSSCNRIHVPGVFPGCKGGRCVGLTTYHHPVPLSRNLGTLTSWNPQSPSGPVMGLLYLFYLINLWNGFGGLGVACWHLVPKFVGSNPAKSSARLPSEGK